MKPFVRLAVLSAAVVGALSLGACNRHDDSATTSAPANPISTTETPVPVGPTVPSTSAPTPTASILAPISSAPMPAAASTAAQPTADTGAFRIDSVKLGDQVADNHKVTHPTTTFSPSDSDIYASVVTDGSTDGSTLSARWRYLEGKGQPVTTISQTIATEGPATTTFHVENPNDWPQGKYQVEISIDGKPVSTETFQIKA